MKVNTVVLGTIGADCHVIGAWILHHSLQKAGFKVVHLGTSVSQEEFIDAAKETDADAVFVSSVYGMASLDCRGLREKCTESGIGDILLYAGGLLAAMGEEWDDVERSFRKMGFDRAYPPGTLPATAIADLQSDLALKATNIAGQTLKEQTVIEPGR